MCNGSIQEPEPRRVPTPDVSEGRVIAYLIASEVFDCNIWFALDDDFDLKERLAVFYAYELPFLREKTPDQLRAIHRLKLNFGPRSIMRK